MIPQLADIYIPRRQMVSGKRSLFSWRFLRPRKYTGSMLRLIRSRNGVGRPPTRN